MPRDESYGQHSPNYLKEKRRKQALRSKSRESRDSGYTIGALAGLRRKAQQPGEDPQAAESVGDLMTPSTFGREGPPSSEQEFQERKQRNVGFLKSREAQAALLQFGISMLSSAGRGNFAGNIGKAAALAAGAPGRLAQADIDVQEKEREAQLQERKMRLLEEGQSFEEEKFGYEKQQDVVERERQAAQDAIAERRLELEKKGLTLQEINQQLDKDKFGFDQKKFENEIEQQKAKLKADAAAAALEERRTSVSEKQVGVSERQVGLAEEEQAAKEKQVETRKTILSTLNPNPTDEELQSKAAQLAAGGDLEGADLVIKMMKATADPENLAEMQLYLYDKSQGYTGDHMQWVKDRRAVSVIEQIRAKVMKVGVNGLSPGEKEIWDSAQKMDLVGQLLQQMLQEQQGGQPPASATPPTSGTSGNIPFTVQP